MTTRSRIAETTRLERALLVVQVEGAPGARVLELRGDAEVVLGRAPGAAIAVDDVHALVRYTGVALELEQLGGRHHARVNDQRIAGPHRLAHGDRIAIGPIRATVHLRGRERVLEMIDPVMVLAAYDWPGDPRDLESALVSDDQDLPEALPLANMRNQLAEIERTAIVAALDSNQGNQTRTAQKLGLSRRALIYKMEKYGLKPPPTRDDS